MSTKNTYTISIYTENNVGLLNRISAIFQRRHINIESINSSSSEIKSVSRITLLVKITEEQMKKIIGQIEKQVEVIKAFYHTDEETIYQESCLFKLSTDLLTDNDEIQTIINQSKSRVINVNKSFFVLEKSGRKEEVEELYHILDKHGIKQFVRSGRIAVTKEEMPVSQLLQLIQQ
ncbi:acetolactate synthase, small subunit [Tenacibaculum mesophilum]|uniref:Acetolactate synthase small subunit n=2 Tax=Tenacibaculum TaxID=104267 RepID=A0AAE9MLS0_9FLAO|nr:acetolactate synthase small subunit [Tenacibaculum mesophilum]GFD83454.1 acetolactate synthase small subunit [Tenacibaculum sp. KUL118]GFD93168.1 acetolactate synthase small subunit [Alteromonas sp. KUL154]GFD98295.1 acetolactate synthase small subunit [Alteromonas sp. KUL156]AZJ31483.1 acetolactate synthase small subunit [Tenacibaculum mesophilum]KAF9657569.1 acetolactate synthase small subunit [Tenacibaculum mesophilum]